MPEGHYPPKRYPGDYRKPVQTLFLPGDPNEWAYPIGPDNNWACDNNVCCHDFCSRDKKQLISDLIIELMRERRANREISGPLL